MYPRLEHEMSEQGLPLSNNTTADQYPEMDTEFSTPPTFSGPGSGSQQHNYPELNHEADAQRLHGRRSATGAADSRYPVPFGDQSAPIS